MKVILWIVVGGAVLFLAIGFMVPSDPEKQRARDAIELCWKEQGRKSLEPSTARMVAGACELMEQRFVDKYRVKP